MSIHRLIATLSWIGVIFLYTTDLGYSVEPMGKWQMVEMHKMVTQR